MQDYILKLFFEKSRWEKAIAKGVAKDIPHVQLRYLCSEEGRRKICADIVSGNYRISPPHTAYIPKDDGTDREVFVNEGIDRVVLSIINDILFEICHHMVHKSCTSYQTGIGCGKVVQQASKCIVVESEKMRTKNNVTPIVGWKSDLSKYFDKVPIEYIDKALDDVEAMYGKSTIITVVREYYHQDVYFDTRDDELKCKYQSLKQGCAVASWLADVILFHIDEALSNLRGLYVRYSDDTLFIGEDYELAMQIMRSELNKMRMDINPKKLEMLDRKHWFKFLGFSIKGEQISLSDRRIKTFQHEIMERTIAHHDPKTNKISILSPDKALSAVNRFLYIGDGEHSWASQVLPIVNVQTDIDELNGYVLDCLRATITRKTKVGGLGFVKQARKDRGCIDRGRGRNVRSNRMKTPPRIEGYRTLRCMANALRTDIGVYRAFVAGLK